MRGLAIPLLSDVNILCLAEAMLFLVIDWLKCRYCFSKASDQIFYLVFNLFWVSDGSEACIYRLISIKRFLQCSATFRLAPTSSSRRVSGPGSSALVCMASIPRI